MFNFLKGKITAASAKSVQPTVQPAVQSSIEMYKKSLADLQKFTQEDIPAMKVDYQKAMEGLEQLSNTMKALTKVK